MKITEMFSPRRYYSLNYAFYDMDTHSHPELEIMYVSSGKCRIEAAGDEITLKKGELVYIGGETPHKLTVDRESPCRVLNLEIGCASTVRPADADTSLSGTGLEQMISSQPDYFTLADHEGIIHSHIVSLHRMLKDGYGTLETGAQAMLLMAELGRRYVRQARKSGGLSRPVRSAIEYIEQHYDQNVTVEDIIACTGLSRSHLQRLFKSETGQTLMERVNLTRIGKSRFLLTESSLPVTDIAFEVGFNSRQHFFEVFRKYCGCSPDRFRRDKGNERFCVEWDWESVETV